MRIFNRVEHASILAKLTNVEKVWDKEVEAVTEKLAPYIQWEFNVVHQPSDGWMILHVETGQLARINDCLLIIRKEGVLSFNSYDKVCI